MKANRLDDVKVFCILTSCCLKGSFNDVMVIFEQSRQINVTLRGSYELIFINSYVVAWYIVVIIAIRKDDEFKR